MLFRVAVRGENACFRRAEFRDCVVSYDVMPPTAAAALMNTLHAAPGFRWLIERIVLLAPLRSGWGTLAVLGEPARTAWLVQHPSYCIAARLVGPPGADASAVERQGARFVRDMLGNTTARRISLGLPECPASVHLVSPGASIAPPWPLLDREHDMGWLPYDTGDPPGSGTRFFRAIVRDGVLDVPPAPPERLVA